MCVDGMPEPNSWYWVTNGIDCAFLALHDPEAAGGWSNNDCWEDVDREVKAWCDIEPAPPLDLEHGWNN